MHTARCRCMTIMTLSVLAALVSAQVTFSRDWSGGKRSPPVVFDCGQFARLCRHFLQWVQKTLSPRWSDGTRSPPAVFDCRQCARLFLHELKEEMSDDKLNKHTRLEPQDIQVNFEEDK